MAANPRLLGFTALEPEPGGARPSGFVLTDTAGVSWYCWFDTSGNLRRAAATVAEVAGFSFATGGTGIDLYTEVAITNAEIKALRATPKTLVAAPGAGFVLQLLGGILIHDYGTNALTESTDNLAVKYTNGSGVAASETIESGGFTDATADKVISIIPIKDVLMVANAALVLHNTGDGEFGGNAAADTVWRAKIHYRVWATGL